MHTPTFRVTLLRTARLMSDEINLILLPYGLNYSLWQVLYLMQQHPFCTSIELSQCLNISKPSITKRVHSLLRLNLIEQQPTRDRRQKQLSLTFEGQQQYQHCSHLIDQFEQKLLQQLSPEHLTISQDFLLQLMCQFQNQQVKNHE